RHSERGIRAPPTRKRRTGPDVPEARGWAGRSDPDRDDLAAASNLDRPTHGSGRGGPPRDRMIGGEPPPAEALARASPAHHSRRERARRHRVLRRRLGDHSAFGDLILYRSRMHITGDDESLIGNRSEPINRSLQQRRAATGEVVQKFRVTPPGLRPKPSAEIGRAAGRETGEA